MQATDPLFKKYVSHVLTWEGLTSADPDDTAASCYPGGIHTNKGVTFCTFKQYAASLGITPVTHQRFLQLSNDDVAKFIHLFYLQSGGDQLPDEIALSVLEASWLSGWSRGVKHLQNALNKINAPGTPLTVDGVAGNKTIAAANAANKSTLYSQYWIERKAFLEHLIANGYYKYRNGWRNRVADFLRRFPVGAVVSIGLVLILGIAFIYRKELFS